MPTRWEPGQVIARREILGYEPTETSDPSSSWFNQCWLELPARVVQDDPDELVLYVPKGTPLTFPPGQWPIAGGRHPWVQNETWQGEGCLMVHHPGEHHAIWHFWSEPDRTFVGWYLNVQTDYRRTANSFETSDLELDYVFSPDLTWEVKDWDAVTERVDEGRFTPELGAWIHAYGQKITARLEKEGPWWNLDWAEWTPPAGWDAPQPR